MAVKITLYLIHVGKETHEYPVDLKSNQITGVAVFAEAAQKAVANPDKKVTVEFVVEDV
jgi:hypothetical protein